MSGAILIVESDAALAQSLHDGLASLGYTVELALHGGDGLMLASLSRPDVVILDADLCDRTGLEVMCQLHELDKSIAVVMLGDSGGDAARRVALKAGAIDYLRKPVEADDLAHAVAAASQGSRPGVVVPFRNERRAAAPFDASGQPCAACGQAIPDPSRAVGYKRALFHPECWLQRRNQRAPGQPR
jgi:two-component system response regulator RegA